VKFGKVIGNYISSMQSPGLQQGKLLLVQPLEFDYSDSGSPFIAIDSVGAGCCEYVLWIGGMEATFPYENRMLPVDACIVGIVDDLTLYGICEECGLLKCSKSVDMQRNCSNQ